MKKQNEINCLDSVKFDGSEKQLYFVNADLASINQTPKFNLAVLPPFLRLLMVTDGTVTKSLEAYSWDPVTVDLQSQEYFKSKKTIKLLGNVSKEHLLVREVLIRGSNGTIYASAKSYLRLELLPKKISKQLRKGRTNIGEAVRKSGLETYRELIDVGYEDGGIFSSNQEDGSKITNSELGQVVYRIYRIKFSYTSAILITERFPVNTYKELARRAGSSLEGSL
ncbi:MAG: DUF98 domain-containing protein [Magnetococcales bacterium]|nr:DUF98 domain-containing protein [Magnetococcales bacterium]